jgi:inorganic pyrophosphatase/exopolyphosphatase
VLEERFQRIEAPAFYISNKRHNFLGNQIGQVRERAEENNQYDYEGKERRDRFILYIFMDKGVDRVEQNRKDNGPHNGRQKGAYYLIRQVTKHQDNKCHNNKIEFIIDHHVYRDISFNNSIFC